MRLIVRRKDGKEVAVFVKDIRGLRLESCIDLVRPDLERWIQQGVVLLIREGRWRMPRKVKSLDGDFLERVEERLKGYGFRTEWKP